MTDKHQEEIVSGYSDEAVIRTGSRNIDFSKAIKLDTTGTVSDAYQVRQDHTLFFVKKLKEEHTGNPVYRDALEKKLLLSAKNKNSITRHGFFI